MKPVIRNLLPERYGQRCRLLCRLGVWVLIGTIFSACQFPGPNKFDPRKPFAAGTNTESVTVTNKLDPELLKLPSQAFTLGPGDIIEVEMIDDIGSRALLSVGPDGKIYFNLLNGVDVWGMTLAEAKDSLERELAQYMREKPQVTITLRIVESKKLWLMGRFAAPGVYPMTNAVTLLEAIYQAGGPLSLSSTPEFSRDYATYNADDNLADLRHSFVLRKGQLVPVDFQRLFRGDLSQNIYMQSDDFVYLPPANTERIWVLGAVAFPQKEVFVRNMTLSMAIANAGGVVKDAYRRQVAIVRGSLNKPQIGLVDITEIFHGKNSDVRLQPGDIVYVPYAPYKLISRYLNVITTTFVSSVAINEGARAAVHNPTTTTGILIPFGTPTTTIVTPATPAH